MKPLYLAVTLAALCGAASIHAADKPAAKPQAPDIAAPKLDPKTGEPQAAFMKSHEDFVAIAKQGKAQVVFLGDSITAGWRSQKDIWEKAFGDYFPANFGIGGDRTQHVLWRIENGELDGISPKVVVLMIGTNNTGGDSAEAIAKADIKIVQTIRAKLPKTKVLVLGVFPRGDRKSGELSPTAMPKIKAVNAALAKLDDGSTIRFLDITDKFLSGGKIPADVMPDQLHPNAKGYQIWADAMQPLLQEMMK